MVAHTKFRYRKEINCHSHPFRKPYESIANARPPWRERRRRMNDTVLCLSVTKEEATAPLLYCSSQYDKGEDFSKVLA
jgi:hypothetical protein